MAQRSLFCRPLRNALLVLVLPALATAAFSAPAELPRLAVVIVVDQMRADYVARFAPHFVEGGFKRFLTDGTAFENCHYSYAVTKTAAGHATVATGAPPAQHGIVANEWLDRGAWRIVASVEDNGTQLIGAPPRARVVGGPLLARVGRSPRALQVETLGDVLKDTHPDSRVIGIAVKDRSALLLAGRRADAAYWVHDGHIVTSSYFRQDLPPWAADFNKRRVVDAVFGQTWERLLPASAYEKIQGDDDAAGEIGFPGTGRSFPHRIDGGQPEPRGAYYDAHSHSPFALDLVGDLALAALRGEKLGQRATPDLLFVSFSQLDTLGHKFGPDSHELMDSMLRLDRLLADFLAALDREVGLEHCVIVLTADHGVSPLPERIAATSPESGGGRFALAQFDRAVEGALNTAFGPLPNDGIWTLRDNFGYHLRPKALTAKNLIADTAARVVQDALRPLPGVAATFTRAELLATNPARPDLAGASRRSYYPPRGHDVVFIPQRYWIDHGRAGTNHGTPYDYDTHVPLLWLGIGVPRGREARPVDVQAIAPTLARLLHLRSPAAASAASLW